MWRYRSDREFIERWNMYVRGIPVWGCDLLLPERLRAFFKDHAKVPTALGSLFMGLSSLADT